MKNFFIKLIAILIGVIFLLNYVYNSFLRENISKFEKIISLNERDNRIEIRGFGSFSLNYRPARIGRNPKSGEKVNIPEKNVPHFKAYHPNYFPSLNLN
jgi:hypothetical protein